MHFQSFRYPMLLMLLARVLPVTGQTYFPTGGVPLKITVNGFRQDTSLTARYYADPAITGGVYRGKTSVMIFSGPRISMTLTDRDGARDKVMRASTDVQLARSEDSRYYYRVFDKFNRELTGSTVSNFTNRKDKARIIRQRGLIVDTSIQENEPLRVNFYRSATDTLVSSYYLERIRLPLLVKGYRTYRPGEVIAEKDTSSFVPVKEEQEIVVSPGEPVRLFFRKPAGLWDDLLLSYHLTQNGTNGTIDGKGRNDVVLQNLEPNSAYTLLIWYTFQKNVKVNLYVRVKPYWYQTTLFYVILGGAILALLIGALLAATVYRLRAAQTRQLKTEQQLFSLQAQLNPHFVFNALGSIQGLINAGNADRANHYLTEFSSLLRSTLRTSGRLYNPLDLELEILRTYLELEQLRFGFKWAIITDPALSVSEIDVPNLFMQPLVENAVKHGISVNGSEGTLTIAISRQGATLSVAISDNGLGFTEEVYPGYGIRLTRDRIRLINQLEKERSVSLTFVNREGTHALLTFANWIASS
ncbi:sensor histidine kinase [Hufsiella ginkgonis]|uniref:Signal transduction histidine kinase internal region domain-containing protein n=1 Tax=Hufsiella ginkgonis TaxID=2695274 RepID=A0A7K1XVN0_9SPHI|nr:histidine kinase [Hufsiella ginkgonis]MXV15040.1 hypothetical protein [Hufsiella ginkgonis]